MRKILLNVSIVVFSVALIFSIVAFFGGSLEAYPTEEQIEKVRIVSLFFILINLIADAIVIRLKAKKKERG